MSGREGEQLAKAIEDGEPDAVPRSQAGRTGIMTAHDHRAYVEGCYRCDLSRDEVAPDWMHDPEKPWGLANKPEEPS